MLQFQILFERITLSRFFNVLRIINKHQNKRMALIRDDWRSTYKSPTGVPEVQNWQGGFLVARDRWRNREHGDVTKQYNWAPTWEDVHHDIVHVLDEHSRNYHELWTEHQCVKLFFDFELTSQPIDHVQAEARIRSIVERIRTVVLETYGVEVDEDHFAWMYSHKINPQTGAIEKFSAHIVLTRGVYFQDGRHLKNFMDFVFSQNVLEEDLARPAMYRLYEGIDMGLYGISRMHRMPLCSKLGEVRPLEIISGHTFDACLITVCPPGLGRVVEYVVSTQE